MNENLNPEHEEARSSETGESPPGQLDYRELFLDHVRKYDLDCIIASRGAGGKQQLLDELRKAADKILGPLAGRIESPDSWVQSVWQQAQDYGYRLAGTTTARTAMDCGQVLQALSDQKQPSSMQFKWFFSNTLGYHWNIGRGGKGIKSVLAITGWDNANLADCRNKLNDAINAIKSFQPSNQDISAAADSISQASRPSPPGAYRCRTWIRRPRWRTLMPSTLPCGST